MIMVRLPYLGALSSQIENEIGPFLKRQVSGRVKIMPRLHLTVLTTRNETWRLWKRISKF